VPRKPLESPSIDFTQAIGLLVRRVRAAAASHELSLTESAVMARLAKDGPATIADLARAESMKPQSMGTTIAALEEMGMVERKPHPDRRTSGEYRTDRQRRRRAEERPRCKTDVAGAGHRQLDEQEQQTLFKAGEIIKRLVESG
jgi:DNA-binding MarR family transcriptional regulator